MRCPSMGEFALHSLAILSQSSCITSLACSNPPFTGLQLSKKSTTSSSPSHPSAHQSLTLSPYHFCQALRTETYWARGW